MFISSRVSLWVFITGILLVHPLVFFPALGEVGAHVVAYQDIPAILQFDGQVEAVKEATVSALVAGRISRIHYDVGEWVPKNAILLEFRNNEQRAQWEEGQATVAEAQSRYQDALTEYERIKSLYEQRLIAKSVLDKAQVALKTSQSRQNATKAQLKVAAEKLEHTVVRAPYGGIITKRQVAEGETAVVGQALMSGYSLEQLRVTVPVSQSAIYAIRQHQEGQILLPDGKMVAATRLTIVPFSQTSSTFLVRLELPAGIEQLYPGTWVKTFFNVGSEKKLLVPTAALVRRGEVTAVYVVSEKKRQLRRILTGKFYELEDKIEVLSGLTLGEKIALNPQTAVVPKSRGEVQ